MTGNPRWIRNDLLSTKLQCRFDNIGEYRLIEYTFMEGMDVEETPVVTDESLTYLIRPNSILSGT
jgi:hypothetical protein